MLMCNSLQGGATICKVLPAEQPGRWSLQLLLGLKTPTAHLQPGDPLPVAGRLPWHCKEQRRYGSLRHRSVYAHACRYLSHSGTPADHRNAFLWEALRCAQCSECQANMALPHACHTQACEAVCEGVDDHQVGTQCCQLGGTSALRITPSWHRRLLHCIPRLSSMESSTEVHTHLPNDARDHQLHSWVCKRDAKRWSSEEEDPLCLLHALAPCVVASRGYTALRIAG